MNPFDQVGNFLQNQVVDSLTKIIGTAGVLAIIVCAAMALLSPDEQGRAKFKKSAIWIFVIVSAGFLASSTISWIRGGIGG